MIHNLPLELASHFLSLYCRGMSRCLFFLPSLQRHTKSIKSFSVQLAARRKPIFSMTHKSLARLLLIFAYTKAPKSIRKTRRLDQLFPSSRAALNYMCQRRAEREISPSTAVAEAAKKSLKTENYHNRIVPIFRVELRAVSRQKLKSIDWLERDPRRE
jgi:hypothetical protein